MRNNIITGIFILILVFFLKTGLAQLDPAKVVEIKQFEYIEPSDMMVDKRGILWYANFNQLQKFDGYDLTHIMVDNSDPGSLQSMIGVFRLMQDSKENIWICGIGDINKYNYETDTYLSYPIDSIYDVPDSFFSIFNRNIIVPCMEEIDSGRIVFGLAPNSDDHLNSFDKLSVSFTSLLIYNPGTDKIERIENTSNHTFSGTYAMSRGIDDDIWILDNNGLFHLDKNLKLEYITEINGNTPDYANVSLKSDSEGNVWILSWPDGLLMYNPESREVKIYSLNQIIQQHPFNDQEYDMEFDRLGNLWITWGKGILHFNIDSEQFTYSDLSKENLDQGFSTKSLCFDDFGNLWIGTTAGLFKYFNQPSFNSWGYTGSDNRELANGWTSRIIEDKNGLVWMSTTSEGFVNNVTGITTFNTKTGNFLSVLNTGLIPGATVNLMVGELYPGKMLFKTDKGFYLYDTINKNSEQINIPGLPSNVNINAFFIDTNKHVWFGTYQGLYELDSLLRLHSYFDLSNFGGNSISNTITGLVPEKEHGIWISTKNGLFFYQHSNKLIERHDLNTMNPSGAFSQLFNSMTLNPDGTLWLGIWQGGLVHYDPTNKSVETFTVANGMAGMSVQGLLFDEKQNHLWLSTFDGISMLNLENRNFSNYFMEDGIRSLKHAEGSFLKTSSGLFIFGGLTGITYFNPSEFSTKSLPPKVFIIELKVGNQNLPFKINDENNGEPAELQFSLKHTQNNISIQYSGIQYDKPERNQFAYRLLNYNDTWLDVKNSRSAYYYDLPPGKFTFQVKASNSNGLWSTPVSVSFEISPPWWKTIWAYVLYSFIIVLFIFVFDRFMRKRIVRRERLKTQERELAQAKEIEKAYKQLEQTHENLKATQTQLIHSEKMASLGELTAGIAHEIQNPLNFVNNFSEVSIDLIEEMNEELANGNDEEVKAIKEDLKQNLEKINHHGNRASSIVKGMLQHSQTSTGKKELTDINALADEYLRLAYHGLRAKDKSFSADFNTDFDPNLPKIDVIPQDIGRVLLNLINNAFYAVDKKAKELTPLTPKGGTKNEQTNYKPTVIVTTSQKPPLGGMGGQVEIRVKDNGPGIPDSIKDKIFQPFFTTKPTGSGTGLGLSLSYDIVKAHGGSITVESNENKGTEFIIEIPLKS